MSCADEEGTFDPAERIYRIDSVIDNTEGGCPEFASPFPVEFDHEPDRVTYCAGSGVLTSANRLRFT